ncbi:MULTISPECIES: hypothetical protein [Vibrio]|uniref:hypothetical protein n=1 Tax=Vibrio TaxID=662 RepID=UPI001CDD174E|nr:MULTISPECIES: hypothetical protein [Vibrio]MCA2483304.1 hypothetical protein [Vibrio alginolyticus]MDW2279609.1 hypothetical protein [Vibrio sp. 1402]
MTESNNFFELTERQRKNVDWLNQVLKGSESESVYIDEVLKPTISRDIAERFLDLTLSQRMGLVSFNSHANLLAYTPDPEHVNSSFKVTNDPDKSKNGYYHWSGSGYEKDAELVSRFIDESNSSEGVSGAAVADYAKGATSFKNITGPLIDNSLINATNGVATSNENYKRTDFIPTEEGALLTYIGACKGMTGFCFYDEDKNYLPEGAFYADLDPEITVLERKTVVAPTGAKYYRACFDKRELNTANAAIMLMSVPLQSLTSDGGVDVKKAVTFSDYVRNNESINLVDLNVKKENVAIVAANGLEASNHEYDSTDFIEIDSYPWNAIYEGYFFNQTGIVGYDKDKNFVETIATGGSGGVDFLKIKITNEEIKYIRACSKKSETPVFKINKTSSDLMFGRFFENKELITTDNVVNDEMIDASNGNSAKNDTYDRTDFIPVSSDKVYRWTGYVTIQTGLVGYDENFQYVDAILWPLRDGFTGPVEECTFRPTEQMKYVRSCTKKSLATKSHSIKVFQPRLDEKIEERVKSSEVELAKQSYIDLAKRAVVTDGEGINTSNGATYKNEGCFRTDYIPVTPNEKVEFKGRTISLTGIAGYDKDKQYVQAISSSEETLHKIYTIPENVFYIRATSYYGYPLSLESSIISPELDPKTDSDVIVNFVSSTRFDVLSKCPDGSYVTHQFSWVDRPQFTDRGWYSPSIYHNSKLLAQGNINMIHIMRLDGADDNIYVGLMHGCEMELYTQFFLDGKRFDPKKDTGSLYGTEFRVQMLSEFYTPDRQASVDLGTEYTVAKLPLEKRAQRFSDFKISANNVIHRYHKLKVLVDNAKFSDIYGAMQQTNPPVMNGTITTNDKDGLRNYFPSAPEQPEPLPPATITMNGSTYGDKNSFATTVSAEGEDDDYTYLMSTTSENADSSQRWKCHLRAWLTRSNAHKFYFQPVITTTITNAYPEYPTDIFNTGDVIEVKSETRLMVSKK